MLNDCVSTLRALAAKFFAHKMLKYEVSFVCSENSSFFDIVSPLEGFSEDCLMIAASMRSAESTLRACDTSRPSRELLLRLFSRIQSSGKNAPLPGIAVVHPSYGGIKQFWPADLSSRCGAGSLQIYWLPEITSRGNTMRSKDHSKEQP